MSMDKKFSDKQMELIKKLFGEDVDVDDIKEISFDELKKIETKDGKLSNCQIVLVGAGVESKLYYLAEKAMENHKDVLIIDDAFESKNLAEHRAQESIYKIKRIEIDSVDYSKSLAQHTSQRSIRRKNKRNSKKKKKYGW